MRLVSEVGYRRQSLNDSTAVSVIWLLNLRLMLVIEVRCLRHSVKDFIPASVVWLDLEINIKRCVLLEALT